MRTIDLESDRTSHLSLFQDQLKIQGINVDLMQVSLGDSLSLTGDHTLNLLRNASYFKEVAGLSEDELEILRDLHPNDFIGT